MKSFGENIDQPTIDHPLAGDHTIARDFLFFHSEIGALMLNEHVIFFKRALIEQDLDTLARGEFALFMLALDTVCTSAKPRLFSFCLQCFDYVLHAPCPFFQV